MRSINGKARVFMFLLSLVLVANMAAAASFQLDYMNRYIWRGFDLNPDNHYVIQPSVNFTFPESNWSINLWYSYSAEDKNLNETDVTFNYDFPGTKGVAVSAGIVHYGWYSADNFDADANTTIETYLTLSWEESPLSPSFSLYHDCKNGNGLYAQLSLSKEFAVSKKQNIELSSSIGYNQKQWISKSGFSDVSATVSYPIKQGKNTITPFAGISWPLLKDINPGVDREYILGVSFAFE